jgi:hypothetical protein
LRVNFADAKKTFVQAYADRISTRGLLSLVWEVKREIPLSFALYFVGIFLQGVLLAHSFRSTWDQPTVLLIQLLSLLLFFIGARNFHYSLARKYRYLIGDIQRQKFLVPLDILETEMLSELQERGSLFGFSVNQIRLLSVEHLKSSRRPFLSTSAVFLLSLVVFPAFFVAAPGAAADRFCTMDGTKPVVTPLLGAMLSKEGQDKLIKRTKGDFGMCQNAIVSYFAVFGFTIGLLAFGLLLVFEGAWNLYHWKRTEALRFLSLVPNIYDWSNEKRGS